MNGFSNGSTPRFARQENTTPRRVKQCESCKARNVLAVPAKGETFPSVCNKCGKYVGTISSYHACPHDPIHRWDEKVVCEKQRIEQDLATRKRRKEVFQTDEIPHLWFHAYKTQRTARNSAGNLYFDGPSIFSYGSHFEIARHAETNRGNAVLFNTDSRSVTTSRHQSSVRRAIPDSVQVFNVANVGIDSKFSNSAKSYHQKNVADYDKRIESALLKAIRARSSRQKEYSHTSAIALRTERNAYAVLFGLRIKPLAPIPALDSKKIDAIKAKEKERIRIESEKTKAAKAERMARAAEAIENWKNGTGDSYGIPYDAPTMLRISSDGSELETSRGARVPISHAQRALTLVRAVVNRGEIWQTNGHTCHVGHYRIERIEANGTVKAGCHVINRDEWERISPALDAYTPKPEETQPRADA